MKNETEIFLEMVLYSDTSRTHSKPKLINIINQVKEMLYQEGRRFSSKKLTQILQIDPQGFQFLACESKSLGSLNTEDKQGVGRIAEVL